MKLLLTLIFLIWHITLELVVRTLNGEAQDYDVKPHDSIATLKRMIEQQNGVPWSEQIILAVDGQCVLVLVMARMRFVTQVRSRWTTGLLWQRQNWFLEVKCCW